MPKNKPPKVFIGCLSLTDKSEPIIYYRRTFNMEMAEYVMTVMSAFGNYHIYTDSQINDIKKQNRIKLKQFPSGYSKFDFPEVGMFALCRDGNVYKIISPISGMNFIGRKTDTQEFVCIDTGELVKIQISPTA